MAVNTRNSIVTNGLVLALDAGNTKSYTSGSTVWGNLINPSLSGSLINGPTFDRNNGGSIVFDGTNDYVEISDNSALTNTSSLSINMWVKSTDVQTRFNDVIGKGSTDDNEEYAVIIGNTFLYFDVGIGSGPYIQNTTTFLNNIWYNICCVHSRSGGTSTLTGYVNGIITPGATQGATNPVNDNNFPLSIGKRFYSSDPYSRLFKGTIATTQIYNRALSQQEILQNYNATKTRFGLQ